jgi:hypothetical protein
MIWLLYIIADAIANWFIIERMHKRPDYLILFLIRGGAAILYGAIVLHTVPGQFLWWFITVTFSFAFPFNLLLNRMRGRALDYYGAESGIIDRWVVKHKLHGAYFITTIVMFVMAVIVRIIFWPGLW